MPGLSARAHPATRDELEKPIHAGRVLGTPVTRAPTPIREIGESGRSRTGGRYDTEVRITVTPPVDREHDLQGYQICFSKFVFQIGGAVVTKTESAMSQPEIPTISASHAGQSAAEFQRAVAGILEKAGLATTETAGGLIMSNGGGLGSYILQIANASVATCPIFSLKSNPVEFAAFIDTLISGAATGGSPAVFSIGYQLKRISSGENTPSTEEWIRNVVVREIINIVERSVSLPLSAVPVPRGGCASNGRFSMVLLNVTKPSDALAIANFIQEHVLAITNISGREISLQTSVGVSLFTGSESGDALLERAETASYCVAHQGDFTPQIYTEVMSRWTTQRQGLVRALASAVRNQELRVYYQPRLDTTTRKIVSVEALVRWQHPTLGLVPPVNFIPIAEETGLIIPIGEWILRESCRQLKEWEQNGIGRIGLSVNISAIQFRDPALVDTIVSALRDTGFDATLLELELTESILMHNPNSTIRALRAMCELGVRVAIDDFGTGYSSLSYLKKFPVDAIKIDQSFTRNVTTNPQDAAITTAVIILGHSLNLRVVAEGVETENQLDFLRVLKCNEVQGFLFSPPVPAEKAAELIRRGS